MENIKQQENKSKFSLSKEVWIGWISSLTEAYNMAIFSFIAPLLAKYLFPSESHGAALLFSYCLVLIGSGLLYPAGAFYFGSIGDKQGRQKTCIYSTLGLALATGCMGLVPFDILLDKTWILFLIFICAQNFFSGGEYHGSIVFSLEHTEETQTGLMSSLSCLFAVFGLILANALASVTILFEDVVWMRACFILGALGGLISYCLKNYCQETPVFLAISEESLQRKDGTLTFIKEEWPKILGTTLVLAFFLVIYSFIFIFLPSIKSEQIDNQAFDTFKSLIIYGGFLVFGGYCAGIMGTNKVMALGACLLALIIIPLCALNKDLLTIQISLTICACLFIGPMHSWTLKEFSIDKRCRGIFMSSAVATSLFGGSTVPICLLIYEKFNSLAICSLYPFVFALASCMYLTRGTYLKKVGRALSRSICQT